MNTMQLFEGKIYQVTHSRKGMFNIKVIRQDEEWATGMIISGKASAIREYNEREQGEEITIRKSLCSFKAIN